MSEKIRASDLRPGDVFRWVDQQVTTVSLDPHMAGSRECVRVWVQGQDKPLHYWADETVEKA